MKRQYWEAVFLMVGMTVGSGIFAVPYVFGISGVGFGILTAIAVTILVLTVHLMYADIVLANGERHRLIGNATNILGPKTGKLTAIIVVLGNLGALLSYTVLGGTFLFALFSQWFGGSLFMYQIAILVLGAFSLSFGAKLIGELNSILTIALIALFLTLTAIAANRAFIPNLLTLNPEMMFGSYGVMLFSLLGTNAIPEMNAMLGKRDTALLRPAVKIGTLIAAAITVTFGAAVAAFCGPYTTKDAITGLATQLGPWVLGVGAIVGLLAVFTSFIIMALSLEETYRTDFGWHTPKALLFTFAPIIVFFLIGARDLVQIITFTGTVLGAGACVIIALIYRKMLKDKKTAPLMRYGSLVPNICIVMLVLGLIVTVTKS